MTKKEKEAVCHKIGERNTEMMLALRRKYDALGYAAFMMLKEYLTENRKGKCSMVTIRESCGFDFRIDNLEEIVGFCTSIGLLQSDGSDVWSDEIIADLKERKLNEDHISAIRKEAGRKGAEARKKTLQARIESHEAGVNHKGGAENFGKIVANQDGNHLANSSKNLANNDPPFSKPVAKDGKNVANPLYTNGINNSIPNSKTNDDDVGNIPNSAIPFTKLTQAQFREQVHFFRGKYPDKMLEEFYNRWRERDAEKRMRFQCQPTWDTEIRLANWKTMQDEIDARPKKTSGFQPVKTTSANDTEAYLKQRQADEERLKRKHG